METTLAMTMSGGGTALFAAILGASVLFTWWRREARARLIYRRLQQK